MEKQRNATDLFCRNKQENRFPQTSLCFSTAAGSLQRRFVLSPPVLSRSLVFNPVSRPLYFIVCFLIDLPGGCWDPRQRSHRIHTVKASSCDICTNGAVPPLCSQEEDDYESPNEDDPEGEDDGDYESPNEEEEVLVNDIDDYEPPPSNDEEALQNSILPAKPFPNTNSMYIGKSLFAACWPWQPWNKLPIELLWVLIFAQLLKNWVA